MPIESKLATPPSHYLQSGYNYSWSLPRCHSPPIPSQDYSSLWHIHLTSHVSSTDAAKKQSAQLRP